MAALILFMAGLLGIVFIQDVGRLWNITDAERGYFDIAEPGSFGGSPHPVLCMSFSAVVSRFSAISSSLLCLCSRTLFAILITFSPSMGFPGRDVLYFFLGMDSPSLPWRDLVIRSRDGTDINGLFIGV